MDSVASWAIFLCLTIWVLCRLLNKVDKENERRRMDSERAWKELESESKYNDWADWKEVNKL